MTLPGNPIFVALDTVDLDAALRIAETVKPYVGGIKLGLEFFMANGGPGVAAVSALGLPVFLDLKLHDIPNTVVGAVRAVAPLAPAILNVHASGGIEMMRAAGEAAHEAADRHGVAAPLMIAVTVLTSLDENDLRAVGQHRPAGEQVIRLAQITSVAGLAGVVCSPAETQSLRVAMGPDFKLVVPGIRPAGAETGDQKRIATPEKTLADGADVLVIGRAITGAANPAAAAAAIAENIGVGSVAAT
ncbi:MAG: orotidine-5'-phosphate decarboxylase [Alphaproteobacteria bacterium]|nr:orotidine-5'-phosphate decarboxylase [Alphaproteobacteria bacterium]